MAKRYLEDLGVAYETVDVSADAERRRWLVEATGMRTVPQIFVGPVSVGGFTDMQALDRRGELRPLLRAHGFEVQDR
jgi:glutaredoxin 3